MTINDDKKLAQINRHNWFTYFDKRPITYTVLLFALYLFVNNTINATSVWMEQTRNNNVPNFLLWEPFVWEYSSLLATILALPILVTFARRFPPTFTRLKRWIAMHCVGALTFSVVHIFLMVWMRKFIYAAQNRHYDFGYVPTEFLYEFRKDAWGYITALIFYCLAKFIYRRLKGEANWVEDSKISTLSTVPVPDHLLVKKLDKEFLVKVDDIEWMEAAGNYVNLHSGGRIYPLRSTLSRLCEKLEGKGFSRTHRSFAINHHFVQSITTQASGDSEIRLLNGNTLPLSRRYKSYFKQNLS